MDEIVIVAAARTGVGKFGGTLAKIPATELGAHVIKGLIAQTGIDPALISEVIPLCGGIYPKTSTELYRASELRRTFVKFLFAALRRSV